MKHPTGPYTVQSCHNAFNSTFNIYAMNGSMTAFLAEVKEGHISKSEAKAVADLFAASPSLLSALKSSTEWMVKERDELLNSITDIGGHLITTDFSDYLTNMIAQIKTNEALIKSL